MDEGKDEALGNGSGIEVERNRISRGCLILLVSTLVLLAFILLLIFVVFPAWFSGALPWQTGCSKPFLYGLGDNPDAYAATRIDLSDSLPTYGPHWTPDGNRIVFAIGDINSSPVEGRIYVSTSDGSVLRAITDRFGESVLDHSPSLSRDGLHIAFSTYNVLKGEPGYHDAPDFERYFEIETANLDGFNRKRLTSEDGLDHSPTWSPDGTQIAFLRSRCYTPSDTYKPEILVANADGSKVRHIIKEFEGLGYYGGVNHVGGLTWSPDGQLLAFTTRNLESGEPRDGKFHAVSSSKIYTVETDGSNRSLLHDVTGQGSLPASLSWSPDGSRLAFAATEDNRLKIFSSDRSGGDFRVVGEPDLDMPADEVEVGRLSWSPDAAQILIPTRNRRSLEDTIYLANADGSRVMELVEGFHAAWSPDGSRIGVVEPRSNDVVLYSVAPDGSDFRPLVKRVSSGGIIRNRESRGSVEEVEVLQAVAGGGG